MDPLGTSAPRAERRLSAILAADIVGYSRLIEADETGTLAAIRALRDRAIDPALAEHKGRIVKLMGDGAIVEFASVVDAVACAVAMQQAVAAAQVNQPATRRILFRIGINLGDVVVEGDDILGDGVNVAARLEQLCEPGGVLVSGTAYDHLQGRLGLPLEFTGEQQVKNISRPVRAYRVRLDGTAAPPLPAKTRRRPMLLTGLAALLLLIVTATSGWFWWGSRQGPDRSGPAHAKPAIAVLAFDNLSGDPTQDYFSDGISEEILNALAQSPYLTVIARNSSFVFKGKPVDVTEVGRTLGVDYVLEGSIRRAENRVRVNAQLIDASTGGELWSDKYDRPLQDIFAVQDEIAGTIAARLDSRIQRAGIATAKAKTTTDLSAYDSFLRGREILLNAASKEATLDARGYYEQAIARDPSFAPPYADLAFTYYREIARRWDPERREAAIATGTKLAQRALALDPTLPSAHIVMGNLVMRAGDFDDAVRWQRKAIDLNPNDPETYAGLANVLLFMNRAGDALDLMRKAILLDPLYPPLYDNYIGRALLLSGDDAGSIPYLSDCIRRLPDSWSCHQSLATAYLRLNQPDSAQREFAEARKNFPFRSIADWRAHTDYQDGPQSAILLDALTKLGLPAD